jgi:hypothetical protein
MRTWAFRIGFFLVVSGIGALVWGITLKIRPRAAVQPIAFNHKIHVTDEGMECSDCHRHAMDGAHATLPGVKGCLLCHGEAIGTHPDEPKIRAYAEQNAEVPWVQVNRLPGHVYFSHAAHVTYGEMDCAVCHGNMRDRSEPVTVSQIGHLDMKTCMTCHQQKGASVDCLRCHK